MMKWCCIIISLLSCIQLSAQNEDRLSVLESYNRTDYHKAIMDLLKIEESGGGDFETKIVLAESYYAQRDFQSALYWLQEAVQINELSSKHKELYADLLKTEGEYLKADSIYKLLGDQFSWKLSKHINQLEPSGYEVNLLPNINTKGDEFAPTYYRDGLVFIGNSKAKRKKYTWNNRGWLQIYYLPFRPKGDEKGSPSVLKIPKVKKRHVGTIAFTRRGNMSYFSQNQEVKRKLKNKVSTLGLYTSKRRRGKWNDAEAFPLNSTDYSISHPTLNTDGSIVFFVSDMPGGYGGTDIYYTEYKNGEWTDPVNLGPTVNTEYDEMFPYLHQDGTLYFASEGHAGYGGLDIFYSKNISGSWSQAVNMGQPINSGYDDFGLILDLRKNEGYFSSNRPGGVGQDDIYRLVSLDFIENNYQLYVDGRVIDVESKEPIAHARIEFTYDGEGKKVVYANREGAYELAVPATVERLLVTYSQKGYFSEEIELEIAGQGVSENVALQKVEVNKGIVVPNIYYQFDSTNINARAEVELMKLYQLLKENSNWIIEIGSHTDSRASKRYNLKLSEERAEKVKNFLVDLGISKTRLFAKGYGESVILNHCVDMVECSEEEHAVNRRTEIKLIGFEEVQQKGQTSTVLLVDEYMQGRNLLYKIQVGAFKSSPNAKLIREVSDMGYVEVEDVEGKDLRRVYISSYPTHEAAQLFLKRVHEKGFKEAFIVPVYKGEVISVKEALDIEKQ